MKKLFLTCAIAAIVFVLSSTVNAAVTTGSSESESQSSVTYVKDSDDSNFFLGNWLSWLLDDIFGWDRRGSWRYYSDNDGSSSDSGGVDWDSGSGGVDWGSGGGDSDSGSGGGDSDTGTGGDDWDTGTGGGDWDTGTGGDDWDTGTGGDDWDTGTGGGDWDTGTGGDGWDTGTGGGDWDTGTGGWDTGSGGGDWGYDDTNSNPVQSIPAPGAFVLGGIGVSIINWLRRRRTL